MIDLKALIDLWPVVIALIGLIVWLVRLEGKVNFVENQNRDCQADVDELRVKHESLDSKVVEQLTQIRESLARLEGALGVKKGEG